MKAPHLLAVAALVLSSACSLEIAKPWIEGVDPCDPNPCEKTGACAAWTGTCAVSADGQGYVCSDWKPTGEAPKDKDGNPLTKPEAFEEVEHSCDGVDNDCDGITDEAPAGDPKIDCPTAGVCAAGPSAMACVAGKWRCDFSLTLGWQASETTCDGVDNDCDGQTDETVSPGHHDCRREGVCATLPPAKCEAGKWSCGYGDSKDYQANETRCDGLDNDCDGNIDSGLQLLALADGKGCNNVGACATGVSIACIGGTPACVYDKAPGWQASETQCDGVDNDCDGKTDNLAGTAVALSDADATACKQDKAEGVCKAAQSAITRTCDAGKWVCNYAAVPYYEAKETLCDGRDNDCDGNIDGGVQPPVGAKPCGDKGVCAASLGVCAGGLWQCDWLALAKDGYQPLETRCDGKDNDCDGEVDEQPTPAGNGCLTAGVCAFGATVTCKDSKATCNYDAVPMYEAGSETSCDGKDNDCDGLTDEGALDTKASGCVAGVCAGKAQALCVAGAWQCDVSKVTGYEKVELTCDGLDNDCDGTTDDEQTLDLASLTCPLTLGVCGTDKQVACAAGKAACNYGADYQTKEAKCDGKDNDCDGQTDFRLCVSGETCADDSACDKGSCTAVRGGAGKQCTSKFGQCAQVNTAGKVELVDANAAVCVNDTSRIDCKSGVWSDPAACSKAAPACHNGTCKLCIPNAKSCDPSSPADVVICDATGTSTKQDKTCPTGKCVGAGLCVIKGEIAINDTTTAVSELAAVDLADGGFAVAWLSPEGVGNTIRVRAFDAEGVKSSSKPTSFEATAAGTYANAESNVALGRNGNLYAVAWTHDQAGSGVAEVRIYDATKSHVQVGLAKLQMAGLNKAGQVAIAGQGTGFVVAWAANGDGGFNRGVLAAQIDGVGNVVTAPFIANAGADSALEDDPAIAVKADGSFAIVWTGRPDFGAAARVVSGRTFAKDGKAVSAITQFATGDQDLRYPSALWLQDKLIVAWGDGNGTDVMVGAWDAALKQANAPVKANKTTAGDQQRPQLSLKASGAVIVVFESTGLAAGSGLDVAIREFNGSLAFAGDETVASSAAAALQERPAVLSFADTRELIVWREKTDAAATASVRANFR